MKGTRGIWGKAQNYQSCSTSSEFPGLLCCQKCSSQCFLLNLMVRLSGISPDSRQLLEGEYWTGECLSTHLLLMIIPTKSGANLPVWIIRIFMTFIRSIKIFIFCRVPFEYSPRAPCTLVRTQMGPCSSLTSENDISCSYCPHSDFLLIQLLPLSEYA